MVANELDRSWRRGAVIAFGLTGPIVACESTDSTEPPTSQTSGGSSSTSSSTSSTGGAAACQASLDDACGECMQAACCESLQACEQDEACWGCVTGVLGEACESSVETHARVDAFLTCRGGSCQEPCIGTTVGSCDGQLDGVVPSDCQGCLETNCCAEVAGCFASEGCWVSCFTMHDEADCHGDADGHALYHAMGACASGACEAECL